MSTQATEIVEEIHVGDIGTILEATIKNINTPVDISSATTKNILLKKPITEIVLTKAGNFTTDGTDGLLDYTTISGDLDESGVWKIQAHIISAAGEWHSDIKDFSVFINLS